MIKSFSVYGLHGKTDHEIILKRDLNILTGRNGTGKTTLLKLLWYMISPNIERTVPEILFREAEVTTDEFTLTITREKKGKRERVKLSYHEKQKKAFAVELMADEFREPMPMEEVNEINHKIDALSSGSVFFPTFRRIEGGFSIGERYNVVTQSQRLSGGLSEVMSSYSKTMSVHQHRFIVSISTEDVEQLLTRQYADVSERTNDLHLELSKFISEKVSPDARKLKTGKRQVNVDELVQALKLLDDIRAKLANVDARRTQLMNPFDVLTRLIVEIFKDKGITVSQNLTFGETKRAIRANILSAGEKQMLSFLCYNAFVESTPIFIDEPELSLHGDWQRMLFPALLSQGTSNQFLVSTHSPFIYSKYPEKEILLSLDKGE